MQIAECLSRAIAVALQWSSNLGIVVNDQDGGIFLRHHSYSDWRLTMVAPLAFPCFPQST